VAQEVVGLEATDHIVNLYLTVGRASSEETGAGIKGHLQNNLIKSSEYFKTLHFGKVILRKACIEETNKRVFI